MRVREGWLQVMGEESREVHKLATWASWESQDFILKVQGAMYLADE